MVAEALGLGIDVSELTDPRKTKETQRTNTGDRHYKTLVAG